MPFDGKPELFTEMKPIDRLIAELRAPAPMWWNFHGCETCAVGVAVRCGLVSAPTNHWAKHVAEFLGIGFRDSAVLFGYEGRGGADFHSVEPHHVAAALEHYRDTGEALSPFEFVKRERWS